MKTIFRLAFLALLAFAAFKLGSVSKFKQYYKEYKRDLSLYTDSSDSITSSQSKLDEKLERVGEVALTNTSKKDHQVSVSSDNTFSLKGKRLGEMRTDMGDDIVVVSNPINMYEPIVARKTGPKRYVKLEDSRVSYITLRNTNGHDRHDRIGSGTKFDENLMQILIAEYINEYRQNGSSFINEKCKDGVVRKHKGGLNSLTLVQDMYEAAKYQADYCQKVPSYSHHNQPFDVPNWEEIDLLTERCMEFNIVGDIEEDLVTFTSVPIEFFTYEEMAIRAVQCWHQSVEGHRESIQGKHEKISVAVSGRKYFANYNSKTYSYTSHSVLILLH